MLSHLQLSHLGMLQIYCEVGRACLKKPATVINLWRAKRPFQYLQLWLQASVRKTCCRNGQAFVQGIRCSCEACSA